MAHDWYRDWFNEDYQLVYSHRNVEDSRGETAVALARMRMSPRDRLLDLCCGAGRHSLAACELGYGNCVGLDLSDVLLRTAAQQLRPCFPGSTLVRGDMLHLPFRDGVFDGVMNFFTSFGYFQSDGENSKVLEEACRVLAPGGRFWFDYLNSEHARRTLEAETERTVHGIPVRERRSLVDGGERLQKIIHIFREGEERVYLESVRLYSAGTLERMLEHAGFSVMETFGAYDGRPLSPDAPRCIFLARKQRGL